MLCPSANVCSRARVAALAGALLAILLAGCGPVVSEDKFLGFAADYALAPELTCDELKVEFGVPELTTVPDPSGIDLSYEEHAVATTDGVVLRVWYVPVEPEREKGVILLSYGAVGEMACQLLLTRELHRVGWSMVMYDYRGFGGSTGAPSLSTLLSDHAAVFDWALERTGRARLVLVGVSLGTMPAVAAAVDRPRQVQGLVLDGVISLQDQLQRFSFLIAGRVAEYLSLFDPRLRIEDQIGRVRQPIAICIYELDEFIEPALAEQLADRAGGPVTRLEFPGLPHARGPYLETERYFAELGAFLEQFADQ